MDDAAAWWGVGIAAVSLCVAMFALGWARETAKAARHANVLQLHDNQRKLLIAFHSLHRRVFLQQEAFEPVALEEFQEHAVTCYLYLSVNLAERVVEYYNKCHTIARNELKLNRLEKTLESLTPSSRKLFEEMQHEMLSHATHSAKFIQSLILDGDEIVNELRKEIKVEPPVLGFWETVVYEYNKPFDWGDEKEP